MRFLAQQAVQLQRRMKEYALKSGGGAVDASAAAAAAQLSQPPIIVCLLDSLQSGPTRGSRAQMGSLPSTFPIHFLYLAFIDWASLGFLGWTALQYFIQ